MPDGDHSTATDDDVGMSAPQLTSIELDRAVGALLGSAAGDALGAGYEFSYPSPSTPIEMIGGGIGAFEPGEWTDDTAMALAIARVTATGLDVRTAAGLDAVAAGFVEWYDSGPKDIGNQTRAVLAHRDPTGAEMQARARSLIGRKGGNGSLMRTAPIGIAYLADEQGCLDAATAVATLTHDDDRATQACRLWSSAIRHAVLHGTFDGVRGYLDRAPAEEAGFWGPLLDQAETGSPQDFPNNGWVVQSLQTVWWAITHADDSGPEHLQRALELAVRAGHDTDTTAAIAGGLLGARWGGSAVPARWRRMLHGWPGLRARDLLELAVLTARGGRPDEQGWPTAPTVDYSGWATGQSGVHPHDPGLLVGGVGAVADGGYDAVVSLCRMGSADLGVEHVEMWLVDAGPEANPNLDFVLDDAARTVKALRDEGKVVLLHCVEGRSRTPSVAARYSMLLGRDPLEVLEAMPWAEPNRALWTAALGTGPAPAICPAAADECDG